jgi:hypothetical protein
MSQLGTTRTLLNSRLDYRCSPSSVKLPNALQCSSTNWVHELSRRLGTLVRELGEQTCGCRLELRYLVKAVGAGHGRGRRDALGNFELACASCHTLWTC